MVEVTVEIDQGGTQCLVYKHRGSRLQGRLRVRTSDKLKVRQISLRLVGTEVVDFQRKGGSSLGGSGTGGSTGALHSYVRKSSRVIGRWIILEKQSSAHVLGAGTHRYSFEIPLPKSLDGTVATRAYSLQYGLETRVEHWFKLKPDSVAVTDLSLVQVPAVLSLHADDRISLNVAPRTATTAPASSLRPQDVPLGRALCMSPDVADQKECFVLNHLWDDTLALRLRLPFGRMLPAGATPVLDIECVPIARNYRVTRLSVTLEEITIVARPQRAGEAADCEPSVTCGDDSQPVAATHSVWAYAKQCSSEYRNATTSVRELAQTSVEWPVGQSLGAYHGILVGKPTLDIPDASESATHANIRNSHIQVHHQLVYVLEYQVASPEAVSVVTAQKEPRIRAAAHVYRTLGKANIVCRDSIDRPATPGRAEMLHGTLPVAVVPRRIADLWAIRDISIDPESAESPVRAAIRDHLAEMDSPALLMPAPAHVDLDDRYSGSLSSGSADPMLSASNANRPASSTPPTLTSMSPAVASMSPAVASMPSVPSTSVTAMPQPSMHMPMPPPVSPPPATNPSFVSSYPPPSPDTQANFSMSSPPIQPSYNPSVVSPALYSPQVPGPEMLPPSGMAMFQRQIEAFQEQQRQAQEQFFRQLTEQYTQMMRMPSSSTSTPAAQETAPGPTIRAGSMDSNATRDSTAMSVHTASSQVPESESPRRASSTIDERSTAMPDRRSSVAPSVVSESAASTIASSSRPAEEAAAPPSYEDLLPPDYEVPTHQPPPYRPVEQR
ncbi:hypothetical protein GGF46_002189 [Coemansia sp. RSA 552]|nr:hypothetical protein GGF46_002189 [Coemansia sp. RSA 552]